MVLTLSNFSAVARPPFMFALLEPWVAKRRFGCRDQRFKAVGNMSCHIFRTLGPRANGSLMLNTNVSKSEVSSITSFWKASVHYREEAAADWSDSVEWHWTDSRALAPNLAFEPNVLIQNLSRGQRRKERNKPGESWGCSYRHSSSEERTSL